MYCVRTHHRVCHHEQLLSCHWQNQRMVFIQRSFGVKVAPTGSIIRKIGCGSDYSSTNRPTSQDYESLFTSAGSWVGVFHSICWLSSSWEGPIMQSRLAWNLLCDNSRWSQTHASPVCRLRGWQCSHHTWPPPWTDKKYKFFWLQMVVFKNITERRDVRGQS